MFELTEAMPKTPTEAAAYIFSVANPTLDDLKVMVLLEAAGQGFYAGLAEAAPNDEMRALFAKSGQEEMGHAHRVARVIKQIHGEDFAIPGPDENPYYFKPEGMVVTAELMQQIAAGEAAGHTLYDGWATALGDEEAARQFRLNGKEELGHGERAQQAITLLAA
jgi:rubrerythrin